MGMTDPVKKDYLYYLGVVVALTTLLCLSVFAINRTVDPLWHQGGNKLFDKNYAFNERRSKTNLYLKNALQYDCIILGSSRATLLNQKHITGYKCFNFAFSAATADELVEYVKYINKMGKQPKYAIVGIDGRIFWRDESVSKSPEFILQLRTPPSLYKDYFSLSSLEFSLKTLLNDSPLPRYYRNDFSPGILATQPYTPPDCVTPSSIDKSYTLDAIAHYQEIRNLWPQAILIGYVPPISAWNFSPLYFDNTLSGYIDAIYEVSTIFDDFYDFSIPSSITQNKELSYDEDHYSLAVNSEIAAIISEGKPHFGLHTKTLTRKIYKQEFTRAVERFVVSKNIQLSSKPACLRQSAAK